MRKQTRFASNAVSSGIVGSDDIGRDNFGHDNKVSQFKWRKQ